MPPLAARIARRKSRPPPTMSPIRRYHGSRCRVGSAAGRGAGARAAPHRQNRRPLSTPRPHRGQTPCPASGGGRGVSRPGCVLIRTPMVRWGTVGGGACPGSVTAGLANAAGEKGGGGVSGSTGFSGCGAAPDAGGTDGGAAGAGGGEAFAGGGEAFAGGGEAFAGGGVAPLRRPRVHPR